MTQSCDGLPIVGALPGRQNELCCLGLGNHPFSLGPALGTALAGMLVGKSSNVLPQWVLPQRFSL
jgi:glycine/D-amino acid oxidase-like deaminating enzyme